MATTSSQEQAFVAGEGDAYFERNKRGLTNWKPGNDIPLRLLQLYGITPTNALEAGAANGARLNALQERYGCRAVAVEPSQSAIDDGGRRFPGVEFYQGTTDAIPVVGVFDLVIVNFVLHWVDRRLLLRSVAEIDRVLEDGGYLLVGDFAPANRQRVPYHHRAGLWTYKQDYAAVFTASGLYHPVAMLTSSHDKRLDASVVERERCATWLLKKSLADNYVEIGAGQ